MKENQFKVERLARAFCEFRGHKDGTPTFQKVFDGFCSGYRIAEKEFKTNIVKYEN